MPLRDHFRSPLDDVRAWDELQGGWPMMIVPMSGVSNRRGREFALCVLWGGALAWFALGLPLGHAEPAPAVTSAAPAGPAVPGKRAEAEGKSTIALSSDVPAEGARAAIERALERRMSFHYTARPLSQVASDLPRNLGINVVVMEADLKAEGMSFSPSITGSHPVIASEPADAFHASSILVNFPPTFDVPKPHTPVSDYALFSLSSSPRVDGGNVENAPTVCYSDRDAPAACGSCFSASPRARCSIRVERSRKSTAHPYLRAFACSLRQSSFRATPASAWCHPARVPRFAASEISNGPIAHPGPRPRRSVCW